MPSSILSLLAVAIAGAANTIHVAAQGTTPPAPTQPGVAANCNTWRIVESSDTCDVVENLYGISHTQFLTWNPAVSQDCIDNFWGGYAYCVGVPTTTPPAPTHSGIDPNCNRWHVVQTGNTCDTIEGLYDITHAQFLAWNPAVSQDCASNFWGGYAYCMGVSSSAPTGVTPSSTTPATTTPPRPTAPGPTFTGIPADCNAWHVVEANQDCDTIISVYGITLADFLSYNPAVSEDCAVNFWLGYAYCVGVGAVTSTPTSTSSSTFFNSTYSIGHPVTSWVISTPSIDNSTWPPTKTQAGQPSYCNEWHLVKDRDDCTGIWQKYGTWMSMADFFAWNPAVGTDCSGLFVNFWVCVGIQPQTILTIELPMASNITLPPSIPWTEGPLPTLDPAFTPTPTHGPMPTNCLAFYQARSGETCEDVLAEHSEITENQFMEWNPVLSGNCAGLLEDRYYCAGAYDQDSLPPPPIVMTKPSLVPADSVASCVAWYMVSGSADTCPLIALLFGTFTEQEFKMWNPSVGADCSGMQANTWYCVAVPGTPTTRTQPLPTTLFPTEPDASSSTVASTSSATTADETPATSSTTPTQPPASTTSEAAITTPQPIQPPMVQGCRRFYFVQPGDGCWQIATDAGISTDDFYAWNPAAAPDCLTLWSNVFVCVGIHGPVATFSGTPPVPK